MKLSFYQLMPLSPSILLLRHLKVSCRYALENIMVKESNKRKIQNERRYETKTNTEEKTKSSSRSKCNSKDLNDDLNADEETYEEFMNNFAVTFLSWEQSRPTLDIEHNGHPTPSSCIQLNPSEDKVDDLVEVKFQHRG